MQIVNEQGCPSFSEVELRKNYLNSAIRKDQNISTDWLLRIGYIRINHITVFKDVGRSPDVMARINWKKSNEDRFMNHVEFVVRINTLVNQSICGNESNNGCEYIDEHEAHQFVDIFKDFIGKTIHISGFTPLFKIYKNYAYTTYAFDYKVI